MALFTKEKLVDVTIVGPDRVLNPAIADQTTAIPAGGTGAAAGGWDTAGNRDTAITAMNNIRTKLNAVLAALRDAGIIVE